MDVAFFDSLSIKEPSPDCLAVSLLVLSIKTGKDKEPSPVFMSSRIVLKKRKSFRDRSLYLWNAAFRNNPIPIGIKSSQEKKLIIFYNFFNTIKFLGNMEVEIIIISEMNCHSCAYQFSPVFFSQTRNDEFLYFFLIFIFKLLSVNIQFPGSVSIYHSVRHTSVTLRLFRSVRFTLAEALLYSLCHR